MSLKNKIKYLSDGEIKKAADDILRKAYEMGVYDFNSPTPLDVIAENILGLQIRFYDLEKDYHGVLGALDLKNKIIWLDQSLDHTETGQFVDEGRCNFTIGHEMGHNVLQGDVILDGGLLAFHNELDPNTIRAEIQANKFSANITMPSKLMLKKWNEDFSYIESYNETITEMMGFFRVSREAMQYRLKDLGLLTMPSY
jgi:Zn-dependent peptidase ImmA (M78 family)